MICCHELRPNVEEFVRPLIKFAMLVHTETLLNYLEQEEERVPAEK